MSDFNYSAMVEQYVFLRDVKTRLESEHRKALDEIDEAMRDIESALFFELDSHAQESVRTAAGTVYKTKKQYVSISDKVRYLSFVLEKVGQEYCGSNSNETTRGLLADFILYTSSRSSLTNWLVFGANKKAIVEFLEAQNELPPGLNFTVRNTVGVRRS